MKQVPATYRDGHIELEGSVDWPDGSPVVVRLVNHQSAATPPRGIRSAFQTALAGRNGLDDSLWPLSPEETQMMLDDMDSAQPLDLSIPEQQAIETFRLESKQWQKELIRKQWDNEPSL